MELSPHVEPLRPDLERLVRLGAPADALSQFVSQWPPGVLESRGGHTAALAARTSVPVLKATGPSPHDREFVKAHAQPVRAQPTSAFEPWQSAALMLVPGVAELTLGLAPLVPSLIEMNILALGFGPEASAGVATEWIGVGFGICFGIQIRSEFLRPADLVVPVGFYGGVSFSDLITWVGGRDFSGLFVGGGGSLDAAGTMVRALSDFSGLGYSVGGDVFIEAGGGMFLLFDDAWNWVGVTGYAGVGEGGGLGVLKTFGGVLKL